MILVTSPKLRAWFGLPTVRAYHNKALKACDKGIPQKPWLPINVGVNADAIRPARLAYLLAVRQRADGRTIGVLCRQYLTVCLRAHRPELVSLAVVPYLTTELVQRFDQPERLDVANLLHDGTTWYHRGMRPTWLGKPLYTQQTL